MALLSTAAVNLHVILQRVIELPIIVNQNDKVGNNRIIPNPNFFRKNNKIRWFLAKTAMQFFSIFTNFRLLYLFPPRVNSDMQQMSIYIITLGVNLCGIAAYWTQTNFINEICFILSESAKKVNMIPGLWLWPSRERLPSAGELVMYYFALAPIAISLIPFTAPFLYSYDPVQLIWTQCFSTTSYPFLLKVVGSFAWGVPSVYAVAILYSFLLGTTGIVEHALIQSKILFENDSRFKLVKLLHLNTVSFQFRTRLALHRQLQVFIRIANNVSYRILFNILFMGSTACVTCVCVIVKLRNGLPHLFCFGAAMNALGYEVTLFALVSLAAIPHTKSKDFRGFWRHLLRKKAEMKELSSCLPFGFSFGPIPVIMERTVLGINDVLVNATASLILLIK
ncbi:unnamed protein product [Orchesella dallaii]|uniref:Odorant receptor n=1 Tax=Orchesella dallaii TaxID=48710 RepID=A0ABP1S8R9_9HEXA